MPEEPQQDALVLFTRHPSFLLLPVCLSVSSLAQTCTLAWVSSAGPPEQQLRPKHMSGYDIFPSITEQIRAGTFALFPLTSSSDLPTALSKTHQQSQHCHLPRGQLGPGAQPCPSRPFISLSGVPPSLPTLWKRQGSRHRLGKGNPGWLELRG